MQLNDTNYVSSAEDIGSPSEKTLFRYAFTQCRRSRGCNCIWQILGQNWLDLGKIGWIWAKLKRNWGKSD